MNSRMKELEMHVLSGFETVIAADIVNTSFPHYESPTADETELAVTSLLANTPVPEDITVKLNTKPTKEMLEAFCISRRLSVYYDFVNDSYVFSLDEFPKVE